MRANVTLAIATPPSKKVDDRQGEHHHPSNGDGPQEHKPAHRAPAVNQIKRAQIEGNTSRATTVKNSGASEPRLARRPFNPAVAYVIPRGGER